MIDVNNLEFWETVKSEFSENDLEWCKEYTWFYLCIHSNTFIAAWERYNFDPDDYRELPPNPDILKLANEFIIDNVQWSPKIKIGDGDELFGDESFSRSEHYQIRIDFVDWCINKFQTK